MNLSAPTGKADKYAHREFERRFLLGGVPTGEVTHTAAILDRYIEGTRLRLRKTNERERPIYKLTQKVPAADGGPGLLTTLYLDIAEYERLATLPARVLEKTRLSIPPFGVDVFAAPRSGLFLAEVELDTEEEMARFTPPEWAIAEVTKDVRFTGARLADTDARALALLLASP